MPAVTVPVPASDRRLCSVEAAKVELGIGSDDTAFDDWLSSEILSASDLVAAACGVEGDDAGDAPATFIQEVATISFAIDEIPDQGELRLPWRHPSRVEEIVVGGVTLDPSLYQDDPKAGLVERRTPAGRLGCWSKAVTVVTVRSGWAADKVPTAAQNAVKRLVRLRWEAKDRNLMIKAEETADVGRTEFWVGSTAAIGSALPDDMLNGLNEAGLVNICGR